MSNTIPTGQYLGDVCDRLALIASGVTGISRTFATVPRLLRAVDLPSVVVFPSSVISRNTGGSNVIEVRQFELNLYFAEAQSGIEGERQSDLYSSDTLDLLTLEFFQRPRLEYNDNGLVAKCQVTGDNGIQLLTYPVNTNSYYIGAIIRLVIERTYRAPIKYSANP